METTGDRMAGFGAHVPIDCAHQDGETLLDSRLDTIEGAGQAVAPKRRDEAAQPVTDFTDSVA